jgi:hypothetical protein
MITGAICAAAISARRLDAVLAGHLDVHDHQVRSERDGQRRGPLAVADLADHLEALFSEHFREIHPNQRIVVGDQHPPPRPVGSHRVCGADGVAFFHRRSPSGNACGARPVRTVMGRRPGRVASGGLTPTTVSCREDWSIGTAPRLRVRMG